jgi:antitoxin HicB
MKDLSYYEGLPYTIVLKKDDDGDVVGRIDELPGCSAHGETDVEALENLAEAKTLWITDCLERNHPVPEPQQDAELPSGKWVQRVPRTLHQRLASVAKNEGVSLNQLVTSLLAEAVGHRTTPTPVAVAPAALLPAPVQQSPVVLIRQRDYYQAGENVNPRLYEALFTFNQPYVSASPTVPWVVQQFPATVAGEPKGSSSRGGKPDA